MYFFSFFHQTIDMSNKVGAKSGMTVKFSQFWSSTYTCTFGSAGISTRINKSDGRGRNKLII